MANLRKPNEQDFIKEAGGPEICVFAVRIGGVFALLLITSSVARKTAELSQCERHRPPLLLLIPWSRESPTTQTGICIWNSCFSVLSSAGELIGPYRVPIRI